jgi:hypothetical protein
MRNVVDSTMAADYIPMISNRAHLTWKIVNMHFTGAGSKWIRLSYLEKSRTGLYVNLRCWSPFPWLIIAWQGARGQLVVGRKQDDYVLVWNMSKPLAQCLWLVLHQADDNHHDKSWWLKDLSRLWLRACSPYNDTRRAARAQREKMLLFLSLRVTVFNEG